MAYASEQEYRDFSGEAVSDAKLGPYLRSAGRWVQNLAPYPDPAPDGFDVLDYEQSAIDAELQVTAYLLTTGGFKGGYSSSIGELRKSENFDSEGKGIKRVIKAAMGKYYKGGGLRTVAIEKG
jgi:hypothetical protein